ncbi:MAG: cation:proton antiporter [Bacteriovoracaceae bacterium]|nr:cation:proton antiporter [Bacteriovoracaceae bacterium]
MMEMLLILMAASIGLGVAKFTRLPYVPLLILAGGGLDYFNAPIDNDLARDALLLGLIFLVFISGTALNPWRIGEKTKLAFFIGTAQFLLLGLLGFFVCQFLGFGLMESSYLGLALCSSSTLVVIQLLKSRGEMFEPFGRMMVGALLIQDILMMLIISVLERFGLGVYEMITSAFLVVALGLIGIVFKKWVIPRLMVGEQVDEEQQLLMALGILFFFMGVSHLFNLPFIAGAFVAGVSLSSFPISGVLKGQFASLNNFFNAIFFVILGFFVELPVSENIWLVALFSVLIILATPALTLSVAAFAGMPFRIGLESGLLLAQTSEFSIVLALIGMSNKHIGLDHLGIITSVTVTTMILTPFLANEKVASLAMRGLAMLARRVDRPLLMTGHFLFFGCGESAMVAVKALLAEKKQVVVIDDDIGVVRQLEEMGVHSILGNGRDTSVMDRANLSGACMAISSMRKFSDNLAVVKFAKETPFVVRVFDQEEADIFNRLGAQAIPATDAASSDFMDWIETKFTPTS